MMSREAMLEEIDRVTRALPARFRAALEEEVRVELCDRPTREQLESVGLSEDELLFGLYEGVPLPDRSFEDTGRLPDVISIFHEDLCEAFSDPQELREELRITLLHELGHYFGMDEEDLDRLGYG